MAITSPPYIVNASFEAGDLSGWSIAGSGSAVSGSIDSTSANASNGNYSLAFVRTTSGNDYTNANWEVVQTDYIPVFGGQTFTVSCDIRATGASDEVGGKVGVTFSNEDGSQFLFVGGSPVQIHQGTSYRTSTLNASVPSWATRARINGSGWIVRAAGKVWVDNFRTSYTFNREVTLTSPINSAVYAHGATVPFRVNISGSGGTVSKVEYYRTDGVDPPVLMETVTSPEWGANIAGIPAGTWTVYAKATVGSTELTSNSVSITIGAPPEIPTREYKASNSYTYLVTEGFAGLGSAMPSVAEVSGVKFGIQYALDILSRTKDLGVPDPEESTTTVPFDITDGGTLEIVMLRRAGDGFEQIGTPLTVSLPIVEDDFTIEETGVSEGKHWVTRTMDDPATLEAGGETFLWEQQPIDASDFKELSFGFRFYPNLVSKPAYADSGDACFRFMLDRIRIQVYFNAGSVEYYFASPDKTQIIKGTLVASNVLSGEFTTGDASGILQLSADLEIMEGSQEWIGNNWTIHAAYPPTDANQIGNVDGFEDLPDVGMRYNGLSTQQQVRNNRSRYQMISANFYGDKDLNSIYGANGLDRAFAHNGKWFYKIYTQPDAEKDKPRHVAYHHWHLALGYEEGRVDISVVGEPYNFDGALGASSWTIGDQVVGLLPLSGTILGVFGSKSVWGISGTTVDNFATQVISPNIGATEYTICDMGFPVYANAYGIYTLSQTQQYGDFLGVPMSQDISPWLRPRLVRKYTTDREVEVAWPVRSKNQYRLAFSDGYVLSMTMNGQAVPTFSKQKYFLSAEEGSGSVFDEGVTYEPEWWD